MTTARLQRGLRLDGKSSADEKSDIVNVDGAVSQDKEIREMFLPRLFLPEVKSAMIQGTPAAPPPSPATPKSAGSFA